MKLFTGYQYLLIDIANQFGLDKLNFEDRIKWAEDHLDDLESLVDQAKAKTAPMYVSAVMALRKAQAGLPTGYMVGLDATCSGIQVMSAMTGCVSGARATGMVDPDNRADAYSQLTEVMRAILGTLDISRDDAKSALMKSFYGSKRVPIALFGEDTPALAAFYTAALQIAPGAWELLQDLQSTWKPGALLHSWKLPDGFDARVKVIVSKTLRIEVDELDHASFTYVYKENEGTKKGVSIVANVTHSMDAWILRSMHRRCNYNRGAIKDVHVILHHANMHRTMGTPGRCVVDPQSKFAYYVEQFNRSSLADATILMHITTANVEALSAEHLTKLRDMTTRMLAYQPFPLVTVHDEFRASPNNMNHVRDQYRQIMAEIADSNVLDDLLSQLVGEPVTFNKLSFNLGDQIRKSAYALC